MRNVLNLSGFTVTQWEENPHDYQITVRTLSPHHSCPFCHDTKFEKHGMLTPEFRVLPMHGKRVGLVVQRQRYRCHRCGHIFLDQVPGMDKHHRLTARLKMYVVGKVLSRPFTALAEEVGLDEKTVRVLFRMVVADWDAERHVAAPEFLGIDEVVMGQPRCVLTNIREQTLVAMLPSRTYERVVAYLRRLPQPARVHWVTMDMWRTYREAVRHALPTARIVVDKFHVLRMANVGLESVRKPIRATLSPKERRILMHDRFFLLRRAQDLQPMERVLVETWTRNLPLLGEAYQAKETFFAIYEASSRWEAERTYQQWLKGLSGDVQPFFAPLTTAMSNWRAEIFAYYDQPVTNAYTESANNLIRAMQRLGRGYSFEVLRAKMLYTAGVQKADTPRYGSETFSPVMDTMTTHRMLDPTPWPGIQPASVSHLLGSDFTKLMALLEAEHRFCETDSTQRHHLEE